MLHFVYKTYHKETLKEYIGVHSTNNIDDGYMGSGLAIRRAIIQYGIEMFCRDILEFFDTKDEAFEYEKQLVTEDYVSRRDTYNMCVGGRGGCLYDVSGNRNPNYGNGHRQRGERNGMFGVRRDDNWKEKQSKRLKQSEKNKKENNAASKKYYIEDTINNLNIDLKKGHLMEWCIENDVKYTTIFATLKRCTPISKGNGKGYVLREGSPKGAKE